MAQLVRSLTSDHKLPGSIPGSAEIYCLLSILPRSVNEFQFVLEANLRWFGFPSRGVKDSHPLSTTETGDKGRMGHSLVLKGFSLFF